MKFVALTIAMTALTLASSCSTQAPALPPIAPSTQPAAGHGAYAACLAKNGVPTPPAGPGAPPGVDQKTWATAKAACADEAPGPAG